MRKEHHHFTPAQVREHIEAALVIVADTDPPEDLRQVAFLKACDWLSAKSIVEEQVMPGMLGMAMPQGGR